MRLLRSVWGIVAAATITLGVFIGVPILSLLGVLPPMLNVVEQPDRVAVYYWEAGDEGFDDVEMELELEPEDLEPEPDGEDTEPSDQPGAESPDVGRTDEEDPDAPPIGTTASGQPRPKRKAGRRCDPEPIPEIRKTAQARWTVERDLVHSYTSNFARLNTLGWSRSHRGDDGKPDGMRIGGVRCNNDLHRAGIRSGDVVHTVNGHRVKNLVQALAVYSRVRKDRVIRVEITRRGERRTHTYRIRG